MRETVIEPLSTGGDFAARYGDILLARYSAVAPDEALARRLDLLDRELAKGRRALFAVVGGKVSATGDALRERMAAIHARHAESIIAYAILLRGQGFQAAAHRSALTSVRQRARLAYPHRIFVDEREAAEWLAGFLPGYGADEIVRAVQALEAV